MTSECNLQTKHVLGFTIQLRFALCEMLTQRKSGLNLLGHHHVGTGYTCSTEETGHMGGQTDLGADKFPIKIGFIAFY